MSQNGELTSISQGWVYKHVRSCQLLMWGLGIWTQVLRLAEPVLLLLPEPPPYSCLFSFAKHFLSLKSNCSFKSRSHPFNFLYKKQVVGLSVWVVKVPWEPLWLLKSGCFGFTSQFSLLLTLGPHERPLILVSCLIYIVLFYKIGIILTLLGHEMNLEQNTWVLYFILDMANA